MRMKSESIWNKLLYWIIVMLCCIAVVAVSLKAFYFNSINDTSVNQYHPNEEVTADVVEEQPTLQEPEVKVTEEVKETIDTSNEFASGVKLEEISAKSDEIIPPIDDEEWAKEYVSNADQEAYARLNYDINDHQPTFGETVYAKENESGYKYGERMYPAVDINIPEEGSSMKNYTGEVDTSNFQYYDNFRITGYSPYCAHCCGGSTSGLTASGNNAVCGYTVSCTKNIPFGTTLYIEGYGFYVVEDRGVPYVDLIDIACPTHEDCYPITGYDVPVYIVSYGTDY